MNNAVSKDPGALQQVYLRNLPALRGKQGVYRIGAGSNGESVFQSSGCMECHKTGSAPLAARIRKWSLTDVAAAMWNHAPRMSAAGATPARLAPGEMRELLSFLWARQFFAESGDPARGRRVYASKHCANCHRGVRGENFNAASMVSSIWSHGPRMQAKMKEQSFAWPRFDGSDMSDLIAFLNGGGTR